MTTLTHFISDIVLVRAQEKVVRVAAGRVVALVKNAKADWDCPLNQGIGDTMCFELEAPRLAQLPVPVLVLAS